MATFAQLMLNSKLPNQYQFQGTANKSIIYDKLTDMAKADPGNYSDYVQHIKTVGDFFATN